MGLGLFSNHVPKVARLTPSTKICALFTGSVSGFAVPGEHRSQKTPCLGVSLHRGAWRKKLSTLCCSKVITYLYRRSSYRCKSYFMSIHIHLLTGSKRLIPYSRKIKDAIKHNVILLKRFLPLNKIDIVVIDSPENTIPHLGISGYGPNGHTLYIYLDPTHKRFAQALEEPLLRTMAHELHHVMRWRTVGYGKSLLDALVSEGLADHFEQEVTKGPPEKWDKALSKEDAARLLRLAKKEFDRTDYDHASWFFGNADRSIPKWTGYSLGYALVKEYLKTHPDKKPSILCEAATNEIATSYIR